MSIYLIATIQVAPGQFARFSKVMGEVQAAVETAGWKLVSALAHRTGRLNTVIDVWELDDMAHFSAGMASVAGSPDFARISATLAEVVAEETLNFADRITYPSPGA